MSSRGSLEGIFAPVRVEPSPQLRAETRPEDAGDQPAAQAQPAGAAGGIRNVAVYLPVALRDTLRDHARARGLTITQVVEAAFAEHGADYAELVGARAETPGTMPTRVSVRRAGATIQVQLRLNGSQHEWLDEQVRRFDAPNRSALVTAVLVRHLRP